MSRPAYNSSLGRGVAYGLTVARIQKGAVQLRERQEGLRNTQPGYQRASHSHRVFKFPIKALRELSLALALLV
jgi:hypothetical protein